MFKLINKISDNFANTLSSRDRFLAEDGLRYIFFSEMLNYDKNTNNYILEQPYDNSITKYSKLFKSNIKNISQELDLLYIGEKDKIALEFKYYKKNNLNTNRTRKCGALFNDILRLNLIDKTIKRLLVYVTEDEMFRYKGSGIINELYSSLKLNKSTSINIKKITNCPKTFVNALDSFANIGNYPGTNINVENLYSKKININGKDTYIFVFEIK